MSDDNHFFDDTRTLTLTEIQRLKQIVKAVEGNEDTIRELIALSQDIRAAKRTWTFIISLAALIGGAFAWVGIDTIANFFGFRKLP